jgi:Uma2 family endonuclease
LFFRKKEPNLHLKSENMNAIAEAKLTFREPKSYSLEEYLRREERSVDKHEFYDGKILKMPNAKFKHNLIATNTSFAIKTALRLVSKKYLVVGDGQKIYIEPENISVYPDGIVICEKPEYFDNQEYLITNPIVVIEVLSRSTQAYDRSTKFDLYKNLLSFKEYVLIDSRKCAVETRFREEMDLWRIRTETDMTNSFTLNALGVSIGLTDVYDNVEFGVKKR